MLFRWLFWTRVMGDAIPSNIIPTNYKRYTFTHSICTSGVFRCYSDKRWRTISSCKWHDFFLFFRQFKYIADINFSTYLVFVLSANKSQITSLLQDCGEWHVGHSIRLEDSFKYSKLFMIIMWIFLKCSVIHFFGNSIKLCCQSIVTITFQ